MTTLFISDLHLTPERPKIAELFFDLLREEASRADALYILGDLFEYWIGDDAAETLGYGPVLQSIRALSDSGVPVYFMRGNRDFLVGSDFEAATGCRVLPDPTVIDLYGQRALLMHGDYLCTDDVEHQRFRATVDDPDWREDFLDKPVEARMQMARDARARSRAHKENVTMEIMDVNSAAVEQAFQAHDVRLMIHGHTHRPAVHNGDDTRRIVLGDWYEQSSVLRCDAEGQHLDPDPG
jgi:UDP-2,3-diacylglucosamine hydrolase